MTTSNKETAPKTETAHIRFSVLGLSILSASLILAGGLSALALAHSLSKPGSRAAPTADPRASAPATDASPATDPPWGDLITQDIELERPEEYFNAEGIPNRTPVWTFARMKADQVRSLMLACGLTSEQVARALSPDRITVTDTNTLVLPDDDLVLSLSPEVRARLYGELGTNPANTYMSYPVSFPGNSFDAAIKDVAVPPAVVDLVRSLLYRRGDTQYFSDFGVVLGRLPTDQQRMDLFRALSRQPAVMARLHVRPTSDVDKLLGYWASAPGVRLTDLRTMLESLKRHPGGGDVSIAYLLPPFARQRLYIYPLRTDGAQVAMDCFWSTMNFFNETPDNRFSSQPGYLTQYLADHYYQLAKPTHYGDLIFFYDEKKNEAVHSAVYIADDIVFTKNGGDLRQPWTLMRLKDLVASYSATGQPQLLIYRNKNT